MSLPTPLDVLSPNLAEDSELLAAGLPQLTIPCATIRISAKHVLKKAAKQLGVLIHGYSFTSLGEDVTAAVSMDLPPHKGNPLTKKHDFYGEWTMFATNAKESACLAALVYLKNAGLIVIHDTNFADMNKYKRKFEEQNFWSSMLYNRAESLQTQLSVLTAVQTTISSHDNTDSTPFCSPKGPPASKLSPEAKERPLPQRRTRRALFIKE